MSAGLTWTSASDFTVGSTPFHCGYPVLAPPPGHLPILKTSEMIEPYVAMVGELEPRRIVELGIRRGGSTALLHELAKPECLVAFELDEVPAPALTTFISENDLDSSIRPFYGVDQADRAQVAAIVDAEVDGAPIDLVVDDASHLYDPTLASFEVLFPRLRPGGLYVIEDWTTGCFSLNTLTDTLRDLAPADRALLEAQVARGDVPEPPRLLALLAVQLVLLRAIEADVVSEVHVDRYWTVVRRGSAPLDPSTFALGDLVYDHMHLFDRVS